MDDIRTKIDYVFAQILTNNVESIWWSEWTFDEIEILVRELPTKEMQLYFCDLIFEQLKPYLTIPVNIMGTINQFVACKRTSELKEKIERRTTKIVPESLKYEVCYLSFFDTKNIDISYLQKKGICLKWCNSLTGGFYYREKDMSYLFFYSDSGKHVFAHDVVCTGFVAYLIYHYKKFETTGKLFESYKQIKLDEYKDEHRHDVDFHKRDLEQEFYKMHVTEEQKRIKNAERVFEYLPTEEQNKIKSYVDNYFDYIKEFIKVDSFDEVQTMSNIAEKGKSVQRYIDADRLRLYFGFPFFKEGEDGNSNFKYLIADLEHNWNKEQLSAIALIIYNSKEFNRKGINTFKDWMRVFCECVGVEMIQYKPSRIRKDKINELERKFYYLNAKDTK